jgi:DNA transposition AAA+ family ATPase
MPTRKQKDQTRSFRQEAFASSVDHERGILANLVASRCQRIADKEEVIMLWWLQQVSWRDGGLEKFCENLLNTPGLTIGTKTMLRLDRRKGEIYTAAEVRMIRAEMPEGPATQFPLRDDKYCDEVGWAYEIIQKSPEAYPVSLIFDAAHLSPKGLSIVLMERLVDPTSPSLRTGIWNLPSLYSLLDSIRSAEMEAARNALVETQVTRDVFQELDFALQTRSFVLIEGREGIGKSESARAWCRQRPGQAIYVRLESGSDETTLYRAIAKELGTACSVSRTAVDMRTRVQDALQPGHLMLVLDEAHFLWPQSGRSERTAPKRLDWLRTAIIDHGVPVALISTPQYFETQCERFRKSGWNANQIQRRLVHTSRLPESLSKEDALRVAESYFPGTAKRHVMKIAGIAMLTIGYLSTITHIRKRVDFLLSRSPSLTEQAAIDSVLAEYVPAATAATPLQETRSADAGPLQSSITPRTAAPISAHDNVMGTNRISSFEHQPA